MMKKTENRKYHISSKEDMEKGFKMIHIFVSCNLIYYTNNSLLDKLITKSDISQALFSVHNNKLVFKYITGRNGLIFSKDKFISHQISSYNTKCLPEN